MARRIAFPTNDRETVESHFGHCREFVICNIEDDNSMNIEYVTPPPHAPGSHPNFLATQNIEAILTGGMGQMAANLFKQNNIQPILGVSGKIIDAAQAYISGSIESKGSTCHGDHGEGHHLNH